MYSTQDVEGKQAKTPDRWSGPSERAALLPDHTQKCIGRDRYNVVVLQDADEFRLLPNHKLDVKEISSRDILSNIISLLLSQFGSWNLKDSSNAKAFSDALTARFSKPDARLLLVKGKIKGATRLEASHGKQKLGINVFVLPPKSISVAFRFVKVSDSAGNPLDRVKDASQNQALLNVLNWTFAPQANVSFDLADTDTELPGRS